MRRKRRESGEVYPTSHSDACRDPHGCVSPGRVCLDPPYLLVVIVIVVVGIERCNEAAHPGLGQQDQGSS